MKKDTELTIVVPQLNKMQANKLRDSLMEAKRKCAPNSKGSIQIGKKENFEAIMKRCDRSLKKQDQ